MKKMTIRKQNRGSYLIGAFVIPIVLMIFVYAAVGIYPFGEKSILTIDLRNQYISFFSYFKEMVKGDRSFWYSFAKTLGGDMVGLTAYYLLSPFNLILLLFTTETLPLGVELITLLKIGFCGLTFYLFISQKEKTASGWIFSTAYALMTYNFAYQSNIMWLDGIMLLPIMALGIQHIFQRKSPFLYLVTLFCSIIFNYYIGFMMCIFSVLYFIYLFIFADKREKFWDGKLFFQYGLSSLLAGGLGMWLIIPVLKSLSGGKAAFSLSNLTMEANFCWNDIFVKLFPGSFDYEQIKHGLPNIYCGIVGLFFVGLYFLNKNISMKKKIGAAVMLAVFYLSFYLNGINLIWHGFNQPSWFPYRYSFCFCFFVLILAWEGFQEGKQLSVKYVRAASIGILGAFLLIAFWMMRKNFEFMTSGKYILGISVMLVAMAFYALYGRQRSKVWIYGLLLVCSAEMSINGFYNLKCMSYEKYESYQQFVKETQEALMYVKEEDDSFYRMEKTFKRTESDPMLLNYNGLSHYSSTEKSFVKYFMGQMGFRNYNYWSYYNKGSTYAADSLLGVKYILSKEPLEEPYQLLETINGISIYQNPYAMPIGFMADDSILALDIDNSHKFELQNALWKALADEVGKDIFCEEEIEDIQLNNLEYISSDFDYDVKKDEHQESSIEYTFTAKSNYPVFGYLGTDDMKPVRVEVNGKELGSYFNTYEYHIMRFGTFEKGEEVTVKIILEDSSVNITDVWFYEQDMDVFQEYYAALEEVFQIEEYSDSRFYGKVSNKTGRDYLLFTIPYEKGWKAYVDGVETETSMAAETFLALKIPEGEHEIEIKYVTEGLEFGILVSGIALLILVGWGFIRQKRNEVR
ncbi:MAG: YfhO family protein [Eubacteriales bacterium]|nr:YfhO family protein [Eubacteriales bacterium]